MIKLNLNINSKELPIELTLKEKEKLNELSSGTIFNTFFFNMFSGNNSENTAKRVTTSKFELFMQHLNTNWKYYERLLSYYNEYSNDNNKKINLKNIFSLITNLNLLEKCLYKIQTYLYRTTRDNEDDAFVPYLQKHKYFKFSMYSLLNNNACTPIGFDGDDKWLTYKEMELSKKLYELSEQICLLFDEIIFVSEDLELYEEVMKQNYIENINKVDFMVAHDQKIKLNSIKYNEKVIISSVVFSVILYAVNSLIPIINTWIVNNNILYLSHPAWNQMIMYIVFNTIIGMGWYWFLKKKIK